jgi:hypothetical protein
MAHVNDTHLNSNETIRESIQKIALHGFVNRETGAIKNVGRTVGYVAKIHTEGDLKGTIDVQEYVKFDANQKIDVGYHEGVLVSVIKSDNKGMLIVPKLYSDVVISIDPESKNEYVSMFSHVDVIQLDSHDTIVVGVKEREKFDDTSEDTPDVDELEETGVFSQTTYVKDSVVTEVKGKGDKDHSKCVIDDKKVRIDVGNESSAEFTKDGVILNGGDLGGLVKIAELEDNLNQLKTYVETLKSAIYTGFNSVGTAMSANGKLGAEAFNGAMSSTSISFKDMENEKVKQ